MNGKFGVRYRNASLLKSTFSFHNFFKYVLFLAQTVNYKLKLGSLHDYSRESSSKKSTKPLSHYHQTGYNYTRRNIALINMNSW